MNCSWLGYFVWDGLNYLHLILCAYSLMVSCCSLYFSCGFWVPSFRFRSHSHTILLEDNIHVDCEMGSLEEVQCWKNEARQALCYHGNWQAQKLIQFCYVTPLLSDPVVCKHVWHWGQSWVQTPLRFTTCHEHTGYVSCTPLHTTVRIHRLLKLFWPVSIKT